MGSICGPGKYSARNNAFIINEDDYIQKAQKCHYMKLNSASNEQLEYLIKTAKRLMNINNSTAFLPFSKYFKKQTPPSSESNVEWRDNLFPTTMNSLLSLREIDKENVTEEELAEIRKLHWEKARKLFKSDNYVIYDTIDVEDVAQGSLGNCYFLSVLATLASSPDIYDAVFIDKDKQRNNCYQLRVFIRGIPKIICLDDYYPCDDKDFFAFAMSGRRELWVQLLEKAWAKINGSYARTIAGVPSEAFACLCEAPCVTYFHKKYPANQLWMMLKREKANGFFIATNTTLLNRETEEQIGLVSGHAYSITNLYEFDIPNNSNQNAPPKKLRLIQLRNPWAWFEWKGKFCDNSDSWNDIPEFKKKIGLINKDDGIFFMDFNDFLKYYPYTFVLKYHKNYYYNYKKLHQESQFTFSCAKITLNTAMSIKVGVHVKQERFYSKVENYTLQTVRIIVAKYDPILKQYTYIGSECGQNDVLYAETDFKFDKGEYHIFINLHWPYNTDIHYTLSTYSSKHVDIDELNRNDIPNDYLEQILNSYLDKYVKKDTLSKHCTIQWSNDDNNTGFYLLAITNNSNSKYIYRATFKYFGCHLLQSDFIKSRDYEKKAKSLIQYTKDIVEFPIMPNERKLLCWRLIKGPCESKMTMTEKQLFEYQEGVFDIANVSVYEQIRDVYCCLKKEKLSNDIEYTEVESNDCVYLVFRNITSSKKSYLIEITFTSLINLICVDFDGDSGVVILFNEQCNVVCLRKVDRTKQIDFEFEYSYGTTTKRF